jgi:hypothetical protein
MPRVDVIPRLGLVAPKADDDDIEDEEVEKEDGKEEWNAEEEDEVEEWKVEVVDG